MIKNNYAYVKCHLYFLFKVFHFSLYVGRYVLPANTTENGELPARNFSVLLAVQSSIIQNSICTFSSIYVL